MALGRTNINLPEIPIKPKLLWLYNEGDEYVDVTGGWSKGVHTIVDGLGTVTKQADRILLQITSVTSDDCPIATVNKVDLTKYSKICASYIGIVGSTTNKAPTMRVSANSVRGTNGGTAVASKNFDGTSSVIVEVDISSVTGEWYVAAGIHCGDATKTATAYIDKVWLEP